MTNTPKLGASSSPFTASESVSRGSGWGAVGPAGLPLSQGTLRDPQGLAWLRARGCSSAAVPEVPLSLCAGPFLPLLSSEWEPLTQPLVPRTGEVGAAMPPKAQASLCRLKQAPG